MSKKALKKRPVYMKRDDAAVTYGFTPRQFRRWTEKGWLPVCRPAGDTGPAYVRLDDLEKFLAERTA
ncbi:hypothetical protein [Nocardioides sp.]|uniref:hypothetical protein n=1 Tax=Nocardioides sp. TaxID=35761 RepID=UPI0037840342